LSRFLLGLLGLFSALGWASLAFGFAASGARADVQRFLATIAVLFLILPLALGAARRHPQGVVVTILSFAAIFRLLAVFAGTPVTAPFSAVAADLGGEVGYRRFQLYDDDVWRYLWDGHVGAAGFSPYRYSPTEWLERIDGDAPRAAEAALLAEPAWWERRDLVRYPNYSTVYPPGAQALFRLSHAVVPGSVFLWKGFLALLDLVTCWFVLRLLVHFGRPREEVLLYAWNPLVIKEIAASGHVDGALVLLLVLGFERLIARREVAGTLATLAAAAVKLVSLPLLPLVLRRAGWAAAAPTLLAAAAVAWFADTWARLGVNLTAFAVDWEFNAGPWAVFRALARGCGAADPVAVARAVTGGLFVTLVGLLTLRVDPRNDRALLRAFFLVLAAAALLGPAVMPWYLLWALPFAVSLGVRSWVVLGALSFGTYWVYATNAEPRVWIALEYSVFTAWALRERRAESRG
jgi:alpha-1,6-mannosyltransferase